MKLASPLTRSCIPALFLALSAVLHVAAPLVSSFAPGTGQLLPVAVLYFAIAYGLMRGWRWLAYVTFILLMVFSSFAIAQMWTPPTLLAWVMTGIVVADWLAVVALFAVLWRARPDLNPA